MSKFYYKREDTVDNVVVYSEWRNAKTNELQLEDFTPGENDIIVNGLTVPNWKSFNRGIFVSTPYSRVNLLTSNQRSVSRLETLVITVGVQTTDFEPGAEIVGYQTFTDYDFLILFWNQMIDGLDLTSKLTTLEIAQLNQICDDCYMHIKFDSDGYMITDL